MCCVKHICVTSVRYICALRLCVTSVHYVCVLRLCVLSVCFICALRLCATSVRYEAFRDLFASVFVSSPCNCVVAFLSHVAR